ncbi:HAD-IA family hydrolase [Litchfieldia salsa]|uniref:Phosphoglycolate phosphatase n=1 Tax=Litchfieldia salsa TaxID=930152 RepID=A0A1H0UMV9_9BACI|nr:HAD-IA family hydrolase [Litchfieldia salsa]SDP67587.1 phosphoglycolate phosphatase [Litchfieldia salsa]
MNILWDFDGTLFDTYPVFTKIFRKVLQDDTPEDKILERLKVSFSHATEFFQLTEEQVNHFHSLESLVPISEIKPFPDVERILSFAENNVIMTHKPRKAVQDILAYYHFDKYFVEIVAGDDGFPRKPDSASYEYLHQRYHLDFAIGDRLLDIIPAKKIGLKTCLFQNQQQGADYYLNDYKDFFSIIQE